MLNAGEGAGTSGDVETDRRAAVGQRPDCVGWKEIAEALGLPVRTVQRYEGAGLPITNWGLGRVAAYADRLRAWAATPRRRAA